MMASPRERAVAVAKVKVMDLPVAPGTRSAAAMVKETPVTWPPRAPDVTPTLAASLLVDTLIPVVLPTVAGPKVTPLRVIPEMPAGTATEVVKTTEDEPPNIVGKAPMEDAAAGGGPVTMKPMG